jgi:PPK2 family polyphosphate:nucleotide phosphotransferase
MDRLKEISTNPGKDFDKKEIKKETAVLLKKLDELQNLLYAESKHAVLVIIQGMDASGKDGVINNVFGQLNPQGVEVQSFKAPTEEEKAHDFLWRIHSRAPGLGQLQIFNRSHYEDVLITRVHGWCDDATALQRFEAINNFEKLLNIHNNTLIFKFYLHVSHEEQQERLHERIEERRKQWKYNENDFEEAKLWDHYMHVYEDVFENCDAIPWTIIPSDKNWYKEYLVAKTVVEAMEELNMKYPSLKETEARKNQNQNL